MCQYLDENRFLATNIKAEIIYCCKCAEISKTEDKACHHCQKEFCKELYTPANRCHICESKNITKIVKQESLLSEEYVLPQYELCKEHAEILGMFMRLLIRNPLLTVKPEKQYPKENSKPALEEAIPVKSARKWPIDLFHGNETLKRDRET